MSIWIAAKNEGVSQDEFRFVLRYSFIVPGYSSLILLKNHLLSKCPQCSSLVANVNHRPNGVRAKNCYKASEQTRTKNFTKLLIGIWKFNTHFPFQKIDVLTSIERTICSLELQ